MKKIVILISGRGSNMQAVLEQPAPQPFSVAAVISNEPSAGGLAIARSHGIPTQTLNHRAFPNRDAFDTALAKIIDSCCDNRAPDLVVLAGFMRVLTPKFVEHYTGRLINIHPSLLPMFPGLHTHRRALEAGIKLHGATVHFVTPDLDHGPIIMQTAVPVLPDDTEAALAARVLAQEHIIYPQAIRWFCEGKLQITNAGIVRVNVAHTEHGAASQFLRSPEMKAGI